MFKGNFTPAAAPAAPAGAGRAPAPTFKGTFVPNEKAAATLNQDGSLDIHDVKPGETVSLRPDPASGNIDTMVVIAEDGTEEAVNLPPVGETVYSESSQATEDVGTLEGQPAPGQQPAQP